MSNWFRFSYLLDEDRDNANDFNPLKIKKDFSQFSMNILMKNGEWKEYLIKPLEKFAEMLSSEYCLLKKH